MRFLLPLIALLLVGCPNDGAPKVSRDDGLLVFGGMLVGAGIAADSAQTYKPADCIAANVASDVLTPIGFELLLGGESVPALRVDWCDCAERFELATFDGLAEETTSNVSRLLQAGAYRAAARSDVCDVQAWARGFGDLAAALAPQVNTAIQGGSCTLTTIAVLPDRAVCENVTGVDAIEE